MNIVWHFTHEYFRIGVFGLMKTKDGEAVIALATIIDTTQSAQLLSEIYGFMNSPRTLFPKKRYKQ